MWLNFGPDGDIDWDVAQSIKTFLKVFFEVTNQFSGSLYVTSQVYFHDICLMHTHIDEWIQCNDRRLNQIAKNMNLKYDKILGRFGEYEPFIACCYCTGSSLPINIYWSFDEMYPTDNLATNLKKKVILWLDFMIYIVQKIIRIPNDILQVRVISWMELVMLLAYKRGVCKNISHTWNIGQKVN